MSKFKEFSVYWWGEGMGDRYEREKYLVSAEEAMDAVKRLTTGPGRVFMNRVIITDGGDCIAFEWTKKDGIVFPKKESIVSPTEVSAVKDGP